MSNWNKENFDVVDVRSLKGNFLPNILNRAAKVEVNNGLCIVQSFEPIPLYGAMAELGFEHETKKISDGEYRVYFCRVEKKGGNSDGKELPFKPTAIVNFNTIDPKLADNVVNFWEYIWANESSAIDMKTRLLLSLANGVGAGRMRQAVRELVKAYSIGVTSAELSDVFAMFAWNQGVGYFASEIGPSALFGAFRMIKNLESKGKERAEIVKELMDKFGDKNPEVNTFFTEASK